MMNIDRIIALDRQLAQWLHLHAAEPLTSLMLGVSLLHEPVVVLLVVALLAAWLWRREAHYWVLALLVTVPGGMLYGFVASFLAMEHRGKPAWALPACVLMVLLVAASRMYLGAHYLSDVLAAMLEGLAWLALCLGTVGALRRRRLSAKP
jgi:membrane-associated phospholipid phosphatase